jgi:hypothetical protein
MATVRHYDHAGKQLYVGLSGDSVGRWMMHKRKSPWVDDVAIMTVDHYPTKEAALDAEAEAILTERSALQPDCGAQQKASARRQAADRRRDQAAFEGEARQGGKRQTAQVQPRCRRY